MTHGGRREGAGRPGDGRTARASVYATPEEIAELTAAADEIGVSLSQYLLESALRRSRVPF